ncbi:MAG: hypothetical protein IRY87_22420 [Acetobacteraceae bacterium]|nr:hypothetical protein [Acetobacteraceae bacterium]
MRSAGSHGGGLRHPGLAGVVGEVPGRLGLTASRRLQLAAEATGAIAFALRRPTRPDDPALAEPSAAVTRWRVMPLPSPPPLPHAPGLARSGSREAGGAAAWEEWVGATPAVRQVTVPLAGSPVLPGMAAGAGLAARGGWL